MARRPVTLSIPMAPEPEPEDVVNFPSHYTSHPSGVECATITRHMNWNLGNAFAYIWRCDLKGRPIEDLEKAAWHLNDEIERRKAEEGVV